MSAESVFQVAEGLVLVVTKRVEDAYRLDELFIAVSILVPDEECSFVPTDRETNLVDNVEVQVSDVGDDEREVANLSQIGEISGPPATSLYTQGSEMTGNGLAFALLMAS